MLLVLSLLTLLFSTVQSTPSIYTTLLKKTNENIVLLAIPTCTELPEDFEGEICLDVEGWSEENEERLCFNVDFVGSGLPPVGFVGSLAELLSKKGSHKITLTHLSHTHSFYIHNSEHLLPSPPPYIFITSIPYMLIMSDHSLSIDYYVLFEGDENAGRGEVRLELTNGESFGIPIKKSGSYDVKLDRKNRIDPGTHSIKLSIHSSPAVSTIFDRVLTPIEGGPNGVGRLMMSKIGKDVDLGVCEGACGSVDLGFGNSVKRKIMYVGMLKYDGQKTIWLEQFKSLNRNKWDMQFSTFMNPENQVNSGEIIKAIEDAGVEIKVKGLPSITEEDLLNTPCEFTEIIKKGGGVNMSIIVTCLLQRLNTANKDLNKLTPKWVKETWKGIVGEINEYEPDILVFANAREITDTLLTGDKLSKDRAF
ncbi:hypothetical protein TrLO_g15987 [Triparma laevis f. longispina]|uniref:Uncharacterized protein n=1 Tax=Triparma laevis f. longispina TaxID=1714387 RepID=A0A9W7ART6_9STRA|nr:hypothetical protein TrLO_g15987 [Triparma laevis f. longispina]